MASKFLRSHNLPAITFSSVFTIICLIFALGSLYNRFEVLEKRFNDLSVRIETKEDAYVSQFSSQEKALGDVRADIQSINSRLPAVRGVSTRIASPAASLAIPTPTKHPTPTGKK